MLKSTTSSLLNLSGVRSVQAKQLFSYSAMIRETQHEVLCPQDDTIWKEMVSCILLDWDGDFTYSFGLEFSATVLNKSLDRTA